MFQLAVIVSIVLAASFRGGPDFHGGRAYLAVILGTLWFAGIVWKRVDWWAGLAIGWVLLSAARVFANPVSPFLPFGDQAVITLDSLAANSFAFVLLAAALVLSMGPRAREYALNGFGWVCLLDSLFVLWQVDRGHSLTDCGGLFGNTSMNACVIAMTYPVLKRRVTKNPSTPTAIFEIMTLIAPPVAILMSHSNMALLALLAAYLSSYFVNLKHMTWRRARKPIAVAAVIALAGAALMGSKLGDNNGRLPVWGAALRWWWAHADRWVGTGLGTYFELGPNIEIQSLHHADGFLLWAHNDWLQILFEMGAIGLAIALACYLRALARAANSGRMWLLGSLAAYGVTMLGNYPMHLPVTGFFAAVLIVRGLCDGYR